MSDVFVFTEMVGCAKIGKIALESYLKHHNYPVHVFIDDNPTDIDIVGSFAHSLRVHITKVPHLREGFKKGHLGTAKLMAQICKELNPQKKIIRFDSDIFFKQECISQTIDSLNDYDIVGTRRCYGNNPGGVPNLHGYPDTVSTYFMGLNLEKLPNFEYDYLTKMWQGAVHPLRWPVLDFADPVIHSMMENGAKVKFLDWNEYGSQNGDGKKTNDYELNLHMDCGSKLTHMGGVASGYSYYNKFSSPEKSYGEWALGRYSLFAKVFYNEDIGYDSPTVYGADGRWINGNYDEHILELVKREIK
jgi:hypothetical protein